ncbi:MAG: hypothetical protein J1E77_09465 [Prevotella sp.]|nr:hypothetical protein [Prevotella sp.]
MRKSIALIALATLMVACQETLEEKAAREARVYTEKNCPSQLSETLRMDSLTFDMATHTLFYCYTLTGAADVDSLYDPEKLRQTLLDELKNTTSIKIYKDAGFNFVYAYYSEKQPGKEIFSAQFSAADYQKKTAE